MQNVAFVASLVIGDLVVLKDSGFTFQSLHADNSMQQKLETKKNLSGVRVWRQGGFVTVDGLEGYEGSFFHELLSYRKEKRELRKTHVGEIQVEPISSQTKGAHNEC